MTRKTLPPSWAAVPVVKTGKISAKMLYDAGVSFCIVGHSESRGRFGNSEVEENQLGFFSETDQTANLKLKSLIFHSISPILCVGETAKEREAGKTDAVIDQQLKGALEGLDASELYFFSVAYEPVWAIGTGQTCDATEANRVCGGSPRCLMETWLKRSEYFMEEA